MQGTIKHKFVRKTNHYNKYHYRYYKFCGYLQHRNNIYRKHIKVLTDDIYVIKNERTVKINQLKTELEEEKFKNYLKIMDLDKIFIYLKVNK